jgi:hypothetical protein
MSALPNITNPSLALEEFLPAPCRVTQFRHGCQDMQSGASLALVTRLPQNTFRLKLGDPNGHDIGCQLIVDDDIDSTSRVMISEVNLETQSDTLESPTGTQQTYLPISSSTICGYPPWCGPRGCRRRKYSLSRYIAHAPPSRSSGEHIFDLLGPVSLAAGGNTLPKNAVHLDRRTWQYLRLFFRLPPLLSSHRLNGPLPSSVCPPSIAVKLSHRRPSCSIRITDDYYIAATNRCRHSTGTLTAPFTRHAPQQLADASRRFDSRRRSEHGAVVLSTRVERR